MSFPRGVEEQPGNTLEASLERLRGVLLELDPDGQQALSRTIEHELDKWLRWVALTGSWRTDV